jgi:hypothetical protein
MNQNKKPDVEVALESTPSREDYRGDPSPKDRRIITTMVAIAGVIVLGLLIFALSTDFPVSDPASENANTSRAPPEDVGRN